MIFKNVHYAYASYLIESMLIENGAKMVPVCYEKVMGRIPEMDRREMDVALHFMVKNGILLKTGETMYLYPSKNMEYFYRMMEKLSVVNSVTKSTPMFSSFSGSLSPTSSPVEKVEEKKPIAPAVSVQKVEEKKPIASGSVPKIETREVKSSDGKTSYSVIVEDKKPVSCSCPSYVYRDKSILNFSCKHMQSMIEKKECEPTPHAYKFVVPWLEIKDDVEHKKTVQSQTDKNQQYTLTGNGQKWISCTCPAFKYSGNVTCKHMMNTKYEK